jgi:hypothetical protein
MPEDMKLLALRENLEPDVRRRVANLFVLKFKPSRASEITAAN